MIATYREGNKEYKEFVHKFGGAPDFDTGDGYVSVWDGADDSSTDEMQYNYSTTADIEIRVLSSANAVTAYAGFDLILINN